ncbi:MAG: hypothetical protein ACP5TI_05200 [Thermoprotei archaeon]
MSISADLYDFVVKIVEDKVRDIKVTREEFEKLSAKVGDLSISINQLSAVTGQLAEAQKRTEERLDRLEQVVQSLAEAQKRTEERLDRLEQVVQSLAEAQKRTEERLDRLEQVVEKLSVAVSGLQQTYSKLSEDFGMSLEDIASFVMPSWLGRRGIQVEELGRSVVTFKDGSETEVDIYADGIDEKNEKVIVIGESKGRIYEDDVNRFYYGTYQKALSSYPKVFGILFGYLIHPRAKQLALSLGLHPVATYELRY